MQLVPMEGDRRRDVAPQPGFVEVDEPTPPVVVEPTPRDHRAVSCDGVREPEPPQRRHAVAGHVDAGCGDSVPDEARSTISHSRSVRCRHARPMASPPIPPPTIRIRMVARCYSWGVTAHRCAYPSTMAHVIDYIELAVDDLAQAKAFYAEGARAGRSTTTAPTTRVSRTLRNPGQEFGGLSPHAPASRGEGVLALVRTDDADAALASVLAAGGSASRSKLHEYPGGRRFTFADPSGNILGVYQPLE